MASSPFLPLVLAGGEDPRQLQKDEYIQGSAYWLPLLSGAGSLSLAIALGSDFSLAATEFVWHSAYQPPGLQLYLEVNGFVALATSPLTVSLVTSAGAAVPNSSISLTAQTPARLRTSTSFTLVSGTSYQVRVKTGTLGAATLSTVRILFLP